MSVAKVYTFDADFDEGLLVNVNHDVVADQLQLNSLTTTRPFNFVHVPGSSTNTVLRINATTGSVVGEYKSCPTGGQGNPSRLASDRYGNVYVGNRDGTAAVLGSIAKIGIVVGGTRCDSDGTTNPSGQYVKDWTYTTCVDRDGDGLLKTSSGLSNVLAWTTDTGTGTDGSVIGAEDDAVLLYRRAGGGASRFVAIEPDQESVWVGGNDQGSITHLHERLDVEDFSTIETMNTGVAGGHGGFITTARVYWSSDHFTQDLIDFPLVRRDLPTGVQVNTNTSPSLIHAIVLDPTTGHVWGVDNGGTDATPDLVEFAADGTVLNRYSMGASPTLTSRTLCYDHVNDHIWTTHDHASQNVVKRWNKSGVLQATISLGAGTTPRGIGMDLLGKIWVCCTTSSQVKRIDPATNTVDLTISVPSRAPYGFTDLGGNFPFTITQPSGFWFARYDHGSTASWGRISWTEDTPSTCTFYVERRIADTLGQLTSTAWTLCDNGVIFGKAVGRYVEVRCTFLRPDASTDTPVLYDLTLETLESVVTPPTGPCAGQLVHPVTRGQVVTPTLTGEA